MAILDSSKPVSLTQREVAVVVAQAIAKARLPVPSSRYRNDVEHIQIDPIVLEVKVTQPKPGVRLQFEAEGGFGIGLNINLAEFEAGPVQYLKDMFAHLYPMLRNSQKMRRNKKLMDSAIYDVLTEGAAANG